jgi:serine/threonine-protein kinase RsbW
MDLNTNGHAIPTTSTVGVPGTHRLEFRVEADPFWLSPIRSFVTDLGLRADLDLDAVADLTMAVDEAVALFLAAATRDQVVSGRVEIAHAVITVGVSLPGRRHLATDTFGWRVMTTLADRVETEPDGTGIRLVKRCGDDR